MKKIWAFSFLPCVTLALFGLSACSSGGGGGDASPEKVLTAEDAIQKLPPRAKEAFAEWKAKIFKTCDASAVVGMGTTSQKGIDTALLLKANNGSNFYPSKDNSAFVIVNGYSGFDGVQTSEFKLDSNENGNVQSIKLATTLSGSKCSVSLFGVKVYETALVRNMFIQSAFSRQNVLSLSSQPVVKTTRYGKTSLIEDHGIIKAISDSLNPNQFSNDLLANSLNIPASEVAQYFANSRMNSLETHVRIVDASGGIWADSRFPTLSAPQEVVVPLLKGKNFQLHVEARFNIPKVDYNPENSSSDSGSAANNDSKYIQISYAISFTSSGAGANSSYVGDFDKASSFSLQTFNEKEAVQCVEDRVAILQSADGVGLSNRPRIIHFLQPSFDSTFQPCQFSSSKKTEDLFFSSGEMKALVVQILLGESQTSDLDYTGWNAVISKLANDTLVAGKDLMSELDPNARTQVYPRIAKYVSNFRSEVGQNPNLAQRPELTNRLSISWALGNKQASQAEIRDIAQALNNSVTIFNESSSRLVSALEADPSSQKNVIRFAVSLTDDYKAHALKAKTLAAEASYPGWIELVFNTILQKQTPVEILKAWADSFNVVKAQNAQYPNLAGMKPEIADLVINILRPEDPTASDPTQCFQRIAEVQDILPALSNSAIEFPISTKKLISNLNMKSPGMSLPPELKASVDYAKALTPEMKSNLRSITALSLLLSLQSFATELSDNILQKHLSAAILASIQKSAQDAAGFSNRDNSRAASDRFLNDQYKKDLISRAVVEETWDHDEFKNLEQIASYGRTKSSCDFYKGYSAVAHCIGLEHFSKKPNQFFDPNYQLRYGPLAVTLLPLVSALDSSAFSTKFNVEHAFFGSFNIIWSSCVSSQFAAKSNELKSILQFYPSADFSKRFQLDSQLRKNLENCGA